MKKLFTFFASLLITLTVFAQAPQKMSYQSVIRDMSDNLVESQVVGIRISILQGSATGTPVFVERHYTSTNSNGLVSLQIGTGTPVTGTFAGIDWSAGPYYVKTETDPMSGTAYSISGTSGLLSVPYAMYAAGGITGPQGPIGPQGNDGPTGPPGPAGPFQSGTGDGMIYWDGSNWQPVSPGQHADKLTFCNGVPVWGPCPP